MTSALVGAHAADDDHVQRAVGLSVAAGVEAVADGLAAGGGVGEVPQSIENPGSERSRSGLSPAVTSSSPALSIPTPSFSSRLGASSFTRGAMRRSRSAISSPRSSNRRASERSAIFVAVAGSRNASWSGLHAAQVRRSCMRVRLRT